MIEITGSRFEGIVSYKKGEFDFTNNCGLTTVSGHNRDSLIAKDQNNGAGKSLLFSMLPNVRFEQTPLADTRKKNRIHSKGSFIEFDVNNLGHKWTIRQEGSGYKIFRDGVDLQVRGQAAQREQIEKIIPLTTEEWYSYVHLQSQKKLEFLYGTPRARMSYITDVWRLDQFDVLRRFYEKKVDEVKIAQNKADVHSHNLLNINDALNKNGWNRDKQKELDEATETVKATSKKVTKLQSKRQELKSLLKQVEFYAETTKQLKKLKGKVKFTKAELKEQYKYLQALEKYEDALQDYNRRSKKLKAKLEELGGAVGGKELRGSVKAMRQELDKLEADDARLVKIRDKHDAAVRELENLDDHTEPELRAFLSRCNKAKLNPMDTLQEEMSVVKTTLKLADLLHNHEGGDQCPTCHQKVNLKDIEATVKAAKKRKGILHSMIHALDIRMTKAKNTEIIEKLGFDEEGFYRARKQIKKLRAAIDDAQEKLENSVRIDEINEQLSELEKPKKPKGSASMTVEELEAHAEMLDDIKRLEARLAEFDEVPENDNLAAQLKEVEKQLKKVEKKYTKAHKVTVKYNAYRAEHKLLTKQRDEVSTKLEEINPLIAKLKLYRAMAKAYSSKGLKRNAMHEIVYGLQQNYNKHAQLIFAEPFKFEVVAKEDGVHITVDRGQGNVSDVRELSGAESDSFRLLHFLACVIMAKDDRRVNLAILDEPDAHMDAATTNLFVERYVPFLRRIVPQVFIITQKGKHSHPKCSYVTVTKHKGVSSVRYDAAS
ncbi:putative ATPase involved in DNA repair [Pseudomonas phage Lu11]|uniref:putative ATPase involved in DNA repair n=1 Tax=Pseudomonas phage Lu11 TaxID=1161927 RepID=UPI00025F1551|nr:putative ATPase involved in DNA repair [Pseudomonas phage Lu11]AFH14650.1 putative ATPase involved in DNA repair [Pseudomonas phage Lu11]